MMADNKIQIYDNKILTDTNKITMKDACCCEGCPEDCSSCTETQVVLSGWNNCDCINGTYTLGQDPTDTCIFTVSEHQVGYWIDITIACDEVSKKWEMEVNVNTWAMDGGVPTGCDDHLGTYLGSINWSDCPAGTYSLSTTSTTCTGTFQATVS